MPSLEYMFSGIKRLTRKPPQEIIHFGFHTAKIMPLNFFNRVSLKKNQSLEMNDEMFFAKLNVNGQLSKEDMHGSAFHYYKRRKNNFYFDETDELKKAYVDNFQDSLEETIILADSFLDCSFEFLGRKLDFPDKINYHYGFDDNSNPEKYFADINYLIPDRDVKITWELNRQQFLTVLGKAYFATGEEKYAQGCCIQIEEWIQQNPYLLGINWIEGIEASIRMYSWIFTYHFIKNSPHWTPELHFKFLKYVYLHGKFIQDFLSDKWLINGNHLLAELSGLLLIGVTFPEFEDSREWKGFAIEKLQVELEKQVFDDGVIWEHSTGYQKFVTEMVLYPVILLRKNGYLIPEGILSKLEKMIEFLSHISMTNGKIPLIGDEDQGFMLKLDNTEYDDIQHISTCGNILFEKDNSLTKSELAFWLFNGLVVNNRSESIEKPNFKLFPDSGYCVFRSQNDYLLFVTTAQNTKYLHAAHRHLDMLSFVYECHGEYFIVDNGTYVYNGDEQNRNLFRSTWMHNTLTIDKKNPCYLGPFELQPKPYAKIVKSGEIEGHPFIWASHNGYIPEHNRTIVQITTGFLISDFVKSDTEHVYESYINLNPQILVNKIDDYNLMLTLNNKRLYVSSLERINVIESIFSPKYGVPIKSKAIKSEVKSSNYSNLIKLSTDSLGINKSDLELNIQITSKNHLD